MCALCGIPTHVAEASPTPPKSAGKARFAAFKEVALKPVELKQAKVRSVYTPRVTDAITAGRAYIYFFPLGQTEPAIITLTDAKEQSYEVRRRSDHVVLPARFDESELRPEGENS